MDGGEQTFSPEFLQNIQSAVNSQGVLGQVQVIETENGPVTVLFMEEGADTSNLVGDNITLTVGETDQSVSETVIEDPNAEVQYQYHVQADDYPQLLQGGVEDAVVSVAETVKEDLAVQPVIDLPTADQTTTQTYEEPVGDASTDTYYITDTGEILKIDSSLLGENAGDATLQLQTQDGTLQILNQVGNVQTSQVETVTSSTYPVSTDGNINIVYDQGAPFEYTATKVDSPLVIDTARVEEPKVLSYKTTNRQRTNIMRQPITKSTQSGQSLIQPKQPALSQTVKSQTSLLAPTQYKTIKQKDASGVTTEVVYPQPYQKQTIVFPKVQKHTQYSNVIKAGQQNYQTKVKTMPQQLITTVMKPQSLLKPNLTKLIKPSHVPQKLSSTQIPVSKVTSPRTYVSNQVPHVNRIQPQVVNTPVTAATKLQTDLLSVAMKQAEVPQQVLSSTATVVKKADVPLAGSTEKTSEKNVNELVPKEAPIAKPIEERTNAEETSTDEKKVTEMSTSLIDPNAETATTEAGKDDTIVNSVDTQTGEFDECKMDTNEQPSGAEKPVIDQNFNDGQTSKDTREAASEASAKQNENETVKDKKDMMEISNETASDDKKTQVVQVPQSGSEMKSIDVPDSDVTIQLFADGTLVTRDKAGTNYSQVKLEDLGLDLSMLEGNTDIELLIVQGDGKEVRATINTSKDVNPTTQSVTQVSKSTPSTSVASSGTETKTTPSSALSKENVSTAPVNEARPYKCSMCPRTFKFYRTYRCHEIVHTKAVTFTCHLCQRLFAREVNLQSHLELHKKKGAMRPTEARTLYKPEGKQYNCDHCTRTFRSEHGLKHHVESQHEGRRKIPCPICGKLFQNEANVQRHSKIHVGPFTCPHCIKVFTERTEYYEHIKSEHADLMYPCKECDAILPSKMAFVRHSKQHSNPHDLINGIKDKECQVCHKKFEKQSELERHKVTHSNEKNMECPACDKKYKLLHSLEKHIRDAHNNDVVFTCSECDEKFDVKTKLDLHVKLFHTGSYQCLTCYEEFPERVLLEEHQFKEHDFAIVCSKCNSKFDNSLKLKNHLKEHTSQNNLCDMCGAGFEHKQQLRTHLINKHFAREKTSMLEQYPGMTNINVEITCDLCGEFWINKPLYKQHLRDVHFGGDTVELVKLFPQLEKTSDPAEPVTCDHCGKTCASMAQMNLHLKTHVKQKRKSVSKKDLNSTDDEQDDPVDFTNIEPRDMDKDYGCQQCGAQFSRKAALEKHVMTVHKKDDLKEALKVLEKEEIARAELEEKEGWKPTPKIKKVSPKKVKSGNKTPASSKIKLKLPFPKSLEKKKIDKQDTGLSAKRRSSQMHICRICEEIFRSTDDLVEHMHDDHGDLDFKIETNSSIDKTDNPEAGKYTDVEYDLKKFKCITCDKIYSTRRYLRKHLRNVHRPKPKKSAETFKCPDCGKGFAERINLNRHMNVKHDIKIMPLNKSASKKELKGTEGSDDEYEAMEDSSTDITAFLGKNFNLGKAHSCNIESVKKKQHICNLCGERFNRDATLKKHLAFHETDADVDLKPDVDDLSDLQPAIYKCKICGQMYSTALGLIHHTRSKHDEVDEETVLAEIAEVDAMLKLESPKKKLYKGSSKSVKRKVESDGEDVHENVKKRLKLDKDGKESYDCKLCGAVYMTYKGLMRHERDVHDGDKATPPATASKYSQSGRLITKSKKKSEEIQCDICSKAFLTEQNLKQHIMRVHKVEEPKTEKSLLPEFKCDHCPKEYDMRINLRRHMKMKHNIQLPADPLNDSSGTTNMVYHCDVCEQKFSTMSNLRDHLTSVHDENDIEIKTEAKICEVCNLDFATQKTLEVHMRKHTGEKPYKCCLCNKQFISKYQLECHMKKLHPKLWSKKVKCKICLMLFESEKAMLKHKVIHRKPVTANEEKSEIEPTFHKCTICEKAFKWKRNLETHTEIYHKESDPQTCGVCNKVFPDRESIKAHMVQHQGKKDSFVCKVCDKKFLKESSLRMHEAQLHKPNSTPGGGMSCDICMESFKSKMKLLEHMLNHTSVMPHKCDECSASFSQESRLTAHKLTHKIKDKKTVKNDVEKDKTTVVKGKEEDLNKKEVIYKCKTCSKKFNKLFLLHSHVAKAHKTKLVVQSSHLKSRITRSRSISETKSDSSKLVPTTKEKKHTKVEKQVKGKKVEKKESKNVKSYFCKKCNLNFIKTQTYEDHMKTVHKKKHDSSKIGMSDQLKISEKKSENTQKNRKIDKKADSASTGRKEIAGYDCPICKKIFSKQFSLKSHIKNVHNVIMEDTPPKLEVKRKKCLYCTQCARVFWSQIQYDSHNKKFHPDKSALELDKQVMQAIGSGEMMQAIGSGEIKTEPVDPMTSPKQTEFETIQHKCEFCSVVHWTKKLFDEHMLKDHPEHASEYGITGDEDSSRPTIEFVNDSEDMMGNLLSVGLYDVSACNKLSSLPVVSIQRINGNRSSMMSPSNEHGSGNFEAEDGNISESEEEDSEKDEYTREYEKFLRNSVIDVTEDDLETENSSDETLAKEDVKIVSEGKETEVKEATGESSALKVESNFEKHSSEDVADDIERIPVLNVEDKFTDKIQPDENKNNDEVITTDNASTSVEEIPVGNVEDETCDSKGTEAPHSDVDENKDISSQLELDIENVNESRNENEKEIIDWEVIDNDIEAVVDSGNSTNLNSDSALKGDEGIENKDNNKEMAALKEVENISETMQSEYGSIKISEEAEVKEVVESNDDRITEANKEEILKSSFDEAENDDAEQRSSVLLDNTNNTSSISDVNIDDGDLETVQKSISENKHIYDMSSGLKDVENVPMLETAEEVACDVQQGNEEIKKGEIEGQDAYEEMDIS